MLCERPIYYIYRNGKREFQSRIDTRHIKPTDTTISKKEQDAKGNSVIKEYALHRYPCRKCLMCLWEKSHEWALRCKLEAMGYENNRFITLTYGQGSRVIRLTKKTLDKFIHNLREHFRRKYSITGIRYFGCGEYGKENLRPHYHIILFNCPPFGDEKLYKKDKAGFPLYKSKILEHLWGKGFCTIGEVTDKSIEYVVRSPLKSYYIAPLPPTVRNEPFILMSKKPGIGKQYLIEHFDEIVESDGVMYDGRKYPIPRSFNRAIKETIGQAEYTKLLAAPRQQRATIFLAQKADQSGITTNEVIYRHRKQVEAHIKKLILHDEQTQI